MAASSMEVFELMKKMHTAVADVSMGHPNHVVVEAITRVAAAFAAGCAADGHEADALVACSAIFTERAGGIH